jgi:hypothetical protein
VSKNKSSSSEYDENLVIKHEKSTGNALIDLIKFFLINFVLDEEETDYCIQSHDADEMQHEPQQLQQQQQQNINTCDETDKIVRAKKRLSPKKNLESNSSVMCLENSPTSNHSLNDSCSDEHQHFENIVCSPQLLQYMNSDNATARSKFQSTDECMKYDIDEQKDLNTSDDLLDEFIEEEDATNSCNLLIASVSSIKEEEDMQSSNEIKSSIGGLYLRNPRGN